MRQPLALACLSGRPNGGNGANLASGRGPQLLLGLPTNSKRIPITFRNRLFEQDFSQLVQSVGIVHQIVFIDGQTELSMFKLQEKSHHLSQSPSHTQFLQQHYTQPY